jgi:hypothetical protein
MPNTRQRGMQQTKRKGTGAEGASKEAVPAPARVAGELLAGAPRMESDGGCHSAHAAGAGATSARGARRSMAEQHVVHLRDGRCALSAEATSECWRGLAPHIGTRLVHARE